MLAGKFTNSDLENNHSLSFGFKMLFITSFRKVQNERARARVSQRTVDQNLPLFLQDELKLNLLRVLFKYTLLAYSFWHDYKETATSIFMLKIFKMTCLRGKYPHFSYGNYYFRHLMVY